MPTIGDADVVVAPAASNASIAAPAGPPVIVIPGGEVTAAVFVLSGVVSGQPLALFFGNLLSTGLPTGVSDTFQTPYTWTLVQSATNLIAGALYIGTGGKGSSGTVTVTCASSIVGGVVIPLLGASTAAALAAVDVSGNNSGSSTTATLSLTPTATGEFAFYATVNDNGGLSAYPAYPWSDNNLAGTISEASYINPPAAALAANWTQTTGPWITLGMVIKA